MTKIQLPFTAAMHGFNSLIEYFKKDIHLGTPHLQPSISDRACCTGTEMLFWGSDGRQDASTSLG